MAGQAAVIASPDLVERIYDTAMDPDLWVETLDTIARQSGFGGAVMFQRKGMAVDWISTPAIKKHVEAFFDEGWATRDERTPPLYADTHPGFRTMTDYWSEEELERMAVTVEFSRPRNVIGGVATIIQGLGHDAIQLTFEDFGSFRIPPASVALLDGLRPHLARAVAITSRAMAFYSKGVTAGLEALDIGGAILAEDGTVRAANACFADTFRGRFTDARGRFRTNMREIDAAVADALAARNRGIFNEARSVAVLPPGSEVAAALHILPLVGRSRHLFEAGGLALIVGSPANRSLPNPHLLRLLYDLTPAESHLARLIGEGDTLAEAALRAGVSLNTVRTHLKSVFAKVGVTRQSDLVRILTALAPPRALDV